MLRRGLTLLTFALVSFLGGVCAAEAVDMSVVTGPLPGTAPTPTTCVGPAAAPPLQPLLFTGTSATGSSGASAAPPPGSGVSGDATITLSQTRTKCGSSVAPRSTTASAEIHVPIGQQSGGGTTTP